MEKALLETPSLVAEAVDEHDLVNFYFGEASTDGPNTIPIMTREKMKKAEREMLKLNGLEKNIPAANFLLCLTGQHHGSHKLKNIFMQGMHNEQNINPDISANLIKVSVDVLSLLNTFSNLGFITYDPENQTVFIRKTPTRARIRDWMLIGLNREFFV